MSLQNYSRVERKVQVKMTLALRVQRGMGDEMTSYQIARALGMKPSMHVTQILAEMVASGDLKCRMVENRSGRWNTYFYSLPNMDVLRIHQNRREIVVKKNGQQVGQLELF